MATSIEGQGSEVKCVAVQAYRDFQQRSLAHIAIHAHNAHMLEYALASGLALDDAGVDDNGVTLAAQAILSRNRDAFRILLSHGSSFDQRDSGQRTLLHMLAIHYADAGDASSGDDDIVNLILRHSSVDVDARDQSGYMALHLTAVYSSASVARALIREGATDVNAVNERGSTPLHFAAAAGDAAIVSLLLDAGADVNVVDSLGNTPLIDAASVSQPSSPHFAFGDENSQSTVVRLLLARGADASAVNLEGNSALFGAVRNGFDDVVEQLSRTESVCFKQRNNRQETALHVAAFAQVTSVSMWSVLLRCCGVESVAAVDQFERTCVSIWMAWPQSGDADSSEDESTLESVFAARVRTVSRLLQSLTT